MFAPRRLRVACHAFRNSAFTSWCYNVSRWISITIAGLFLFIGIMGCFAWLNSRFAIPERDWVGFDMLVIVCVIVFVFVIAGCARLVTWWRAGTLCANLTTVSRECRDCICFTFVYMLIMSFGLALIWFHMYLQDQGYLTRRISVIAFLGMEAA